MTFGELLQRPSRAFSLLRAASLLLALTRCTGTVAPATQPSPPATRTVAVGVTPGDAQIAPGGTVAFAAAVTGTADPTVTWEVAEAAGGTVSASGVYTAPATAGTFHVRAVSHAAPAVQGTAAVTVTAPPPPPPPVTVTVSPSTGAVAACRTLTFSAAVTGTTDGAVAWSVQEGAAGGTVDANGVYTAPSTAGTYHVVATSAASVGATATVPVTVSDSILSVTVSPQSLALAPGETAQLTATVTTTCGTFASVQSVTAPL